LDNISITYKIAGLIIISYFLGSIPFGFIFGKLKGLDLREHGSRNIGATNAGRVLGKKYFYISLVFDAAKGFFPTFLASRILFVNSANNLSQQWLNVAWLIIAFSAVAGHNWPCWLGFKGGKGVATSLGIVLAIYPYYTFPGLIAFVCWIIIVKVSGYVSLGSMISAAIFLFSFICLIVFKSDWRIKELWPLLVFASIMVAILIYRHRSNIYRLKHGTENKFSLTSK